MDKKYGNASFRKNYNRARLEKNYERVKKGIAKLLDKEINDDFTKEIKTSRISRLEKKKDYLEKLQKELETYLDEKFGITVAVQTTQSGDIPDDLFSIVDKSIEITGKNHENALADCGFASYETLEKMETKREENFYVPDKLFDSSQKEPEDGAKINAEQFKKKDDGEYYCPDDKKMVKKQINHSEDGHYTIVYECKDCENCKLKKRCTTGKARTITIDSREPYREKMRKKLKSDKGREIYMKRQWMVEPGHGDDQKNKGWKQHLLRGKAKASLEFLLVRIGSNFGKIIRYKGKEALAM